MSELKNFTITEDSASRDLVDRWRDGDESAANELYQRYCNQLLNLVSNNISSKHAAKFDAEDVLQTAFRTLFRRTKQGEFQFDKDSDVWKLLVSISLNKLRRRIRDLNREKRDIRRESSINEFLAARLTAEPTLEEASEFADLLGKIMSFLNEQQCTVIQLRLEGYDQKEIAQQLGVTDRTVRRQWERIREAIIGLLDMNDG